MATYTALQDLTKYRFSKPKVLDEVALAAGAYISSEDFDSNAKGNKPLALIGDALTRMDVAITGLVGHLAPCRQ